MESIVIKERFNSNLAELIKTKHDNSSFISKEKYIKLQNDVRESKAKTTGKTPADYHRLKHYDLINVGDCEKLIYPVTEANPNIRYYLCTEEIFDAIHQAHLSVGHVGRDKMMKELKKRFKNITTEAVVLYINLCEDCKRKSKSVKKVVKIDPPVNPVVEIKPKVTNEMESRGQIDLIDMQNQQDNEFKFILVYQDQVTKFVQLRPLKSNQAEEVAYALLNIFTIFGAPSILQSNNGRQFSSKIVETLCFNWYELKIVHGRSKSCKTSNQDIKNMLNTWLDSNRTNKWSEGLRFVQLMKNRTYHEGIKRTPYEAMFGSAIKVGLKSSYLPNEVVLNLRTEEELEKILNDVH